MLTRRSGCVARCTRHPRRPRARSCASRPFDTSPKLTSFLRFVVESTLAGQGERLKGYTIGVEALGRGENFDPQIDPIVRVEAIRLRAALARYYAGDGVARSRRHRNAARPLRAAFRLARRARGRGASSVGDAVRCSRGSHPARVPQRAALAALGARLLPPRNRIAARAPDGRQTNKLKARLPRGLADRGPAEIAATRRMIEAIRAVYERYGFEPVETPAIEYTDALGKFLPDQDRPNEGVFSFQDDDEQWLSLRYDLTAPLARYVAENFDALPKPYRAIGSAGCSATRSRARAASASSCSSTPTRWARAAWPPTPRFA